LYGPFELDGQAVMVAKQGNDAGSHRRSLATPKRVDLPLYNAPAALLSRRQRLVHRFHCEKLVLLDQYAEFRFAGGRTDS